MKHCLTCTCAAEEAERRYCDAEVQRGHETFLCLEQGPDGQHPLPHRGSLVAGPCPTCDGLDTHAEGCARIGTTEVDDEGPTFEVTWGEDGAVVLLPWPPGP